jgi:hypothetical protein
MPTPMRGNARHPSSRVIQVKVKTIQNLFKKVQVPSAVTPTRVTLFVSHWGCESNKQDGDCAVEVQMSVPRLGHFDSERCPWREHRSRWLGDDRNTSWVVDNTVHDQVRVSRELNIPFEHPWQLGPLPHHTTHGSPSPGAKKLRHTVHDPRRHQCLVPIVFPQVSLDSNNSLARICGL